MDEQPVKKKACDSLIGRISHDIQIASVNQPMTEVCTTAGWANHKTVSRLQTRHISAFPFLPENPSPVAPHVCQCSSLKKFHCYFLATRKTLKTPL